MLVAFVSESIFSFSAVIAGFGEVGKRVSPGNFCSLG
jgi:hypothetical protein